MIKRSIGILLALIMAFVLVGCNSKTTELSSNDATKKPSATEEVETSNFNETGMPIVNEPITLTAVFNSHPNTIDFAEMESFQMLEKKTNIKLDVEAVRSGWAEKKSLILAGGTLPDIFFGQGLNDDDILNNKSFFVNLVPLIDKYGSNIQLMFAEEPTTKRISTVPGTGEIFGLPNVRPFRPKVGDSWFINTEWLQNVGMELPTTLEEFSAVLTAFKEQDANGNGDANDEIPLNFDTSGMHFTWKANILGAFGLSSDKFASKAQVRDGNVQLIPAQEGYKEAVKYMHDLYSNGLVNPEVFTQSNYYTVGKADDASKVGVGVQWQAATLFGQWAAQYEVLPPLAGSDGTRQITQNPMNIRLNKNVFSITTANKYPEATMRWVNELYTEEMSIQMFFGSIGPAIEETANGYHVLDPPEDSGLSAGSWKWTMAPADRAPMYCSYALEKKTTVPQFHLTKLDYDKVVEPYVEPVEHSFPMVMWTPDVTEELAILKNDIFTYVDNKTADWIINGGVEDQWDEYITQVKAMGSERLVEIYQKAYDSFMAN